MHSLSHLRHAFLNDIKKLASAPQFISNKYAKVGHDVRQFAQLIAPIFSPAHPAFVLKGNPQMPVVAIPIGLVLPARYVEPEILLVDIEPKVLANGFCRTYCHMRPIFAVVLLPIRLLAETV